MWRHLWPLLECLWSNVSVSNYFITTLLLWEDGSEMLSGHGKSQRWPTCSGSFGGTFISDKWINIPLVTLLLSSRTWPFLPTKDRKICRNANARRGDSLECQTCVLGFGTKRNIVKDIVMIYISMFDWCENEMRRQKNMLLGRKTSRFCFNNSWMKDDSWQDTPLVQSSVMTPKLRSWDTILVWCTCPGQKTRSE